MRERIEGRFGRQAKKRTQVLAAKVTGDGSSTGKVNAVGYLPPFSYPKESIAEEAGDPDAASLVGADPVRAAFYLRKGAPIRERAVGLDVETGQPVRIAFSDHQAVIGRDRHAIGKPQITGNNANSARRVNKQELRATRCFARIAIKAEAADVAPTLPRDDHVFRAIAHIGSEVGVAFQARCGREARQPPLQHDDDEPLPGWELPEPRWVAQDLDGLRNSARGVDEVDRVAVNIRDTDSASPRPWGF